jgi:hypothetical protein
VIVALFKRNFTARRRRSFNTTRGTRCISVFFIPLRRFSLTKYLTHQGRIDKAV